MVIGLMEITMDICSRFQKNITNSASAEYIAKYSIIEMINSGIDVGGYFEIYWL